MKNFVLALSLLLALTACGSGKEKPADAIVGDPVTQVSIPGDAAVTDYSCEEIATLTRQGTEYTESYKYSGISYDWEDGQVFVNYDVDNNGKFKDLSRTRADELAGLQRYSRTERSSWYLDQGSWKKTSKLIERLTVLENGSRRTLSYKVDGIETAPTWISETSGTEKSWRTIDRHQNPSARNEGDRYYSRIEQTCNYNER